MHLDHLEREREREREREGEREIALTGLHVWGSRENLFGYIKLIDKYLIIWTR